MATVSVVSIFTRGARSSETAELRQTRALNDIARCNEVWNTGFPGGWRCNIQFTSRSIIFREDITINANTVSNVDDARVMAVIEQARATTNNAIAIYVVYLNGEALQGGQSNANGGPFFTSFTNANNFQIIGRVVMTDSTIDSYILAHEAGHVLFGRFVPGTNDFIITDPSNPAGSGHSQDSQNVMYFSTPAQNPVINSTQCNTAHQSRVILENVQTNVATGAVVSAANNSLPGSRGEASSSAAIPRIQHCGCCQPHHHEKDKKVKKLNRLVEKEIVRYGPCEIQLTPFPKKRKHHHKCTCGRHH